MTTTTMGEQDITADEIMQCVKPCDITGCDQVAEVTVSWVTTVSLDAVSMKPTNSILQNAAGIGKPFIDPATGHTMVCTTMNACGSCLSILWDKSPSRTKDTIIIKNI